MRQSLSACLLILLVEGSAHAQSPTGNVIGIVTDPSGAVVAGVQVTIINVDTEQARTRMTSAKGHYAAAALPPGAYRVTAETHGFKKLQRDVQVEAGTTTRVDLVLEVGSVSESVTVSGANPLLQYDHHQIADVIGRELIDNVPLNGRNFLELSKLQAGVSSLVRATNNRSLVPMLGAGLQSLPRVGYTAVTIDGGSVTAPGSLGSGMQMSQEVVQEFQIATVNFDASTNATSTGAINVVSRSGGNVLHGGGFFFHRDNNLSAYPGLRRDPGNPDPSFERRHSAASAGGPIRKDRVFFFLNYERTDQQSVFSVQPPQFPALGGIFPSPYEGGQFSARVDMRLGTRHEAFARYTHDGNDTLAPGGGPASATLLPSAWSRLANHVDQSMVGVTTTVSSTVLNDARVSYFSFNSRENPAGPRDCSECIGLGEPRVTIQGAMTAFGSARTLSYFGKRYQLSDTLVWQRGQHRFRFGFDWQHSSITDSGIENDPATITLWSPEAVRQLNARVSADARIPLPASFVTLDDLLQLPLRSFRTSVGPAESLQRGFARDRIIDQYRLFIADTWRMHSRLTLNAGLGWLYEPNALNDDLTKPALLVPLLDVDGLKPPRVQLANFSPTIGWAWTATEDGRTVVRAGTGRYYDPISSTNSTILLNERFALSPVGTGRLSQSGSNIRLNGERLDFPVASTFTGATLLANLQSIRSQLSAGLNPGNRDFSLRNLDRLKEASSLFDPFYRTPYAVHASVGVQHEVARNVVVGADIVWKRFGDTFISSIDYNRWNSAGGPVIPACTAEQRDDVSVACSNGPMSFSNTSGRARYQGLLVNVNTGVIRGTQVRASYALGSYVGTNGPGTGTGFNNDDWSENYGPLPTDLRHIFNLSGFVELPRDFQLAFNVSAFSRPPLSAIVNGVDFNGDGTTNDLLPGTTVNQLGRGVNQSDLAMLVERYNEQNPQSRITLPADYSFNDTFSTVDVRITRTFAFPRGLRLSLIGDVFNLFNTANLAQYGGGITEPSTFGQPAARFDQVFGSGGPRAFQLGIRLRF